MIRSDYLIIGSGITGLSLALKASKSGSVSLVTKKKLYDSNTVKAQGGIACVIDKSDSFKEHIRDTLTSGDGLCNEKMVERMVVEAPERIKELIELGVKFTKKNDCSSEFDLGLEGGHTKRRILHVGDITGNEIEKVLIENVLKQKSVAVYENHIAIDLILDKGNRCRGAYVLKNESGIVEVFEAKIIVLTCGGAGKTYLYTSNPDVSTGDGIAMAYRAGANVSNMEFVQFHPTCLYNPKAKSFLISEAVRGEGGILRLQNGRSFMEDYHPLKDLAPRDIVARAIDKELKKTGESFVYLDITAKSKAFLVERFPNIYAACLKYGVDMSKDMIPVVPAAHFFCGGVMINENGQTNIKNLYAAGETACSGVHGANRLASNSLLDSVIYADRVYKDSLQFLKQEFLKSDIGRIKDAGFASNETEVFIQEWEEIRLLVWNYLGVVRSDNKLLKAQKRIEILKSEIERYFEDFNFTVGRIEVRNIVFVAEMIVRCAVLRKESRGLHFNTDYPYTLPKPENTVINIKN